MKNISIVMRIPAAFLLMFGVAATNAQQPERNDTVANDIVIEARDFGVGYAFSKASAVVVIKNIGNKSVTVDRIQPSTGADKPILSGPFTIRPHESIKTTISVDVGDRYGRVAKSYDVFLNGNSLSHARFTVRGFSDWIVDPGPLSVNLGTFPAAGGIEKKIDLTFRTGSSLKLTKVSTPGRDFKIEIDLSGKSFRIQARPGIDWGLAEETILIDTDSSLQPKIGVHVLGESRGDIVPSSNLINFGAIREHTSSEQTVRLESASGKSLGVSKIGVRGTKVLTKLEDCIPTARACKLLRVTVEKPLLGSPVAGVIDISLDGVPSRLQIRFMGIVIGAEEAVTDLAEELRKQGDRDVSVSSILKSSIGKPAEMAVPEGGGPLLTWQVTGGTDVYGFEIYRSVHQEGPFTRVSDAFIGAIGSDKLAGAVYRWRDSRTSGAGSIYWYYIGVVRNDGSRQVLTSPQRVVEK